MLVQIENMKTFCFRLYVYVKAGRYKWPWFSCKIEAISKFFMKWRGLYAVMFVFLRILRLHNTYFYKSH